MKKIITALSVTITALLIPCTAFAQTTLKLGGSNLPQSFWWAIMIVSAAVIAVTTIMIARMVIKIKNINKEDIKDTDNKEDISE